MKVPKLNIQQVQMQENGVWECCMRFYDLMSVIDYFDRVGKGIKNVNNRMSESTPVGFRQDELSMSARNAQDGGDAQYNYAPTSSLQTGKA